jgi:hypothetical protein
MFELVYLSRESFDVMTVIKILKRFCVDRIVSPVVGKTQRLLVIFLVALLFELDMKRFLKNCLVLSTPLQSKQSMTISLFDYLNLILLDCKRYNIFK